MIHDCFNFWNKLILSFLYLSQNCMTIYFCVCLFKLVGITIFLLFVGVMNMKQTKDVFSFNKDMKLTIKFRKIRVWVQSSLQCFALFGYSYTYMKNNYLFTKKEHLNGSSQIEWYTNNLKHVIHIINRTKKNSLTWTL